MKIATRSNRPLLAACVATACFAIALFVLGAMLAGYSPLRSPVELPGASGLPHAGLFNALAFVAPGLLCAGVALAGIARGVDGPSLAARLAGWIALFSTLSFAALGLLPLDPAHLDAPANRLHAVAWSLWWLTAATSGTLAFAGGHARRGRGAARSAAAWLVPGLALFAPAEWSGIAQRLAFAAWFAWWILGAEAVSRSAASTPGSSPQAPA